MYLLGSFFTLQMKCSNVVKDAKKKKKGKGNKMKEKNEWKK